MRASEGVRRHQGSRLHQEGRGPVLTATVIAAGLTLLAMQRGGRGVKSMAVLSAGTAAFLAQFFRHPGAETPLAPGLVVAPAFGRIVHVGTEEEPEILADRRVRISIFLSVFDPHLTRAPVAGRVSAQRHTPGRYLVALHPKASLLNERSSVLIESDGAGPILVRSIAGLLARRICTYVRPGMRVDAGEEIGYIKFGSRVDLFVPPDADILVTVGETVRAGETPLARVARP